MIDGNTSHWVFFLHKMTTAAKHLCEAKMVCENSGQEQDSCSDIVAPGQCSAVLGSHPKSQLRQINDAAKQTAG